MAGSDVVKLHTGRRREHAGVENMLVWIVGLVPATVDRSHLDTRSAPSAFLTVR